MRKSASFTIEEPIIRYVERTAAKRSKSQRVNELLKRAIELERREQLEREAAKFFAAPSKAESAEVRAFQKASVKSIARE